MPSHDPAASLAAIEQALARHASIAERIQRALLVALHSGGACSVDQIHDEARRRARTVEAPRGSGDDNTQTATGFAEAERAHLAAITRERAALAFSPEEIDDLVNLALKREEARALEEIANLSTVSFRLLAEKVHDFCRLPRGGPRLPESEAMAVRVALTRHFISDQLEFIGVARRFLLIRDFDELIGRIIGDEDGMGRIGGKAAGMLVAHRILQRADEEDPQPGRPKVVLPDSWYLRSDVIERFLERLGLTELQSHKYKEVDEIRAEYPVLVKMFKSGSSFPPGIVDKLRSVLSQAGESPLIVRSSSLLEDRFGAAFAGKYRSIFVPNQGALEERLAALLGAIAEVYASTLHPDPISYRRKHDLLDYPENMAVLIQKVVGRRCGRYFLPVWSGVAFSRNEYRRNTRIKPEDGIARMVFGLGTRAVDRVAADFPRMIPLGAPTIRPEVTTRDIVRRSQYNVDAIDLSNHNAFTTVPLGDVLEQGEPLPGLDHVVSIHSEGYLRQPVGRMVDADPQDLVITFDKLVHGSPWPGFLRWVVQTLEKAYGLPVDIEFAFDGEAFHLLQCRPQAIRRPTGPIHVPEGIPAARTVFSASRDVTSGSVPAIEYVVLIDPADYDPLPDEARRLEVARAVSRLNRALAGRTFILMGPGRWGSRDPLMGVKVGYADIDNTRMLIEIARARGGFVPEASFGSHFFQDLVESDILYLALYPDDPQNAFNEGFLRHAPNALARLAPEFAHLDDVVRVIHVPTASGGMHLRVDMDTDTQRALGYLSN